MHTEAERLRLEVDRLRQQERMDDQRMRSQMRQDEMYRQQEMMEERRFAQEEVRCVSSLVVSSFGLFRALFGRWSLGSSTPAELSASFLLPTGTSMRVKIRSLILAIAPSQDRLRREINRVGQGMY